MRSSQSALLSAAMLCAMGYHTKKQHDQPPEQSYAQSNSYYGGPMTPKQEKARKAAKLAKKARKKNR